MHYLVINGSPHKGNTWKLFELARAELMRLDASAAFEELHLSELSLPFCKGCSLCFRKGHAACPHNAVVQPVIDAIERADAVLFPCTTFFMRETAMVKNVMDHMCCFTHRPRFFTKKALVITTTGGVGAKQSAKSITDFLGAVGFNRCYALYATTMSWNAYEPDNKVKQKASRVTERFYRDVAGGRLHSPKCGLLIPYNLFRGMCPNYAPGTAYESYDGVFWTDPERRKYAYDKRVPLPFYKKLFGGLFYRIGRMAGRMVNLTYQK